MLMGFPQDYWSFDYLQDAISPFGKLLSWVDDKSHLTRVLIRARVIDLPSVPHFIVYFDAPGFEGDSWTIQCEILQHQHLGGGPLDEESVPEIHEIENAGFQFFGPSQPINGLAFDLNQVEQPEHRGDDWPEPQGQHQAQQNL